MISLISTPLAAEQEIKGVKGQNYDRLVFDNPTDGAVEVVARVQAINRFSDSSSTILLTDNGKTAFGPESDPGERWTRKVAVQGKGRHELVLICQANNAAPVYCALNPPSPQASSTN